MVLRLKAWESRSLPGLPRWLFLTVFDAGWSSLVARQAHNLKVGGSNPSPATNLFTIKQYGSDLPVGRPIGVSAIYTQITRIEPLLLLYLGPSSGCITILKSRET